MGIKVNIYSVTNTTKGRFSGGLSIYYKERLNNDLSVINTHQSGIMLIKLSKQLFNFDEDIFICNTYILPTSSDFFEQLESDIAVYKNSGKIFLAGDLPLYLDYDPYLSIFINR